MRISLRPAATLIFLALAGTPCIAQERKADSLDQKVTALLEKMKYRWRDMNVPAADGQLLHDIILKNKYTRALELGTSTGHSGIWIAWALSKTGGKLITVEIDAERHREAVANFKEAGLSEYIDARLADAHRLVEELPGPFDFVFIDADKEWYVNYARAVIPKLEAGGCITAHNVTASMPGRWGRNRRGGSGDYYEFMSSQADFETSILPRSQGGLAASIRKKPQQ